MQVLLAFIDDDIEETLAVGLEAELRTLCGNRLWHSMPEYVYETERATMEGDADIVTLGAFIRLEAHGSGDEAASLADTEAFVLWWATYSSTSGKTVGFQLDREGIGWIMGGDKADLQKGLIDPWRASLQTSG